MTDRSYSLIIPVYNRPNEIRELLESLTQLLGNMSFETVIVEDGSTISCKHIVEDFQDRLDISYIYKKNTGPGDSRNFGIKRAKGNYFLIFDSDCLLPPNYLQNVDMSLDNDYMDCFGGPDAAHSSFTNLQKAINFSMTSIVTTGGIRGNKVQTKNFQPRSFNMGISKEAFEASQGFGSIHPGEDPDLSIRLNKLGYRTGLIKEAFVYHKRRISWHKFYTQVHKFGLVRPILNQWYPETAKLIYWFPTLFMLGFMAAIMLAISGFAWLLWLYAIYYVVAFVVAIQDTGSITIALMAMIAISIQFYGYGIGFLESFIYIKLLRRNPRKQFPKLFFEDAK